MITEFTKCDRCGKAWQSFDSSKDKGNQYMGYKNKYLINMSNGHSIDLCKDCENEFTKWLEGGTK